MNGRSATTDAEMRAMVIDRLKAYRDRYTQDAELERGAASNFATVNAAYAERCLRAASEMERFAAHYQQAIDLLSAATMPQEEESR